MTLSNQSTPAVLRLAQSRSALLMAIQDDSLRKSSAYRPSSPELNWLAGLRLLKTQPGAHLLVQALQQIWTKSPWHILAKSAAEMTTVMLTPVAQRSPVKLIAGAFFIGGLLFLMRPWRLLSKSGVIGALLGR